jgi:hypothetical protein
MQNRFAGLLFGGSREVEIGEVGLETLRAQSLAGLSDGALCGGVRSQWVKDDAQADHHQNQRGKPEQFSQNTFHQAPFRSYCHNICSGWEELTSFL